MIENILVEHVQITCDDGTVGWGEPVVEGRAQTVEAAVNVSK